MLNAIIKLGSSRAREEKVNNRTCVEIFSVIFRIEGSAFGWVIAKSQQTDRLPCKHLKWMTQRRFLPRFVFLFKWRFINWISSVCATNSEWEGKDKQLNVSTWLLHSKIHPKMRQSELAFYISHSSFPTTEIVARVMQVKKHFFLRYNRSSSLNLFFFVFAPLSRWAALESRDDAKVRVQTVKTNYFYFSQTFWWLSWASSYEHINHLAPSCMIVRSFTSRATPRATVIFFQKKSSPAIILCDG